jgi:rhodanese-related sulfurtransferase
MDINVQELKKRLDAKDDSFVFIDVREPHEYADFNLGATLIPLGNVPAALADLEDHKEDEIVVHCRSGARSGQAKAFMMANGFKNVRNLEGGVLAWMSEFGK